MNFDAWVAAARPQNLGGAEREMVTAIGDALRDPVAPAPLEPEDAFIALCRYAPTKFSYTSVANGIVDALHAGAFNCGAASDLVVGVLLYLCGRDLEVTRFNGVFGGRRPVVTPAIGRPGVRIQNNLDGGGGRMLFSGGHIVAVVDGLQYDLISGLRGHHIDFTEAVRNDAPDGTPAFDFQIDGADYRALKLPDNTREGLATYSVAPPLPDD